MSGPLPPPVPGQQPGPAAPPPTAPPPPHATGAPPAAPPSYPQGSGQPFAQGSGQPYAQGSGQPYPQGTHQPYGYGQPGAGPQGHGGHPTGAPGPLPAPPQVPPYGTALPPFLQAPWPPYAPPRMPNVVRAAQVLLFVGAGYYVLLAVTAGMTISARAAGQLTATGLSMFGAAICALRFGGGRQPTRITAIVFTAIAIAAGIGAARTHPTGPAAILAIVGVVLLAQHTTRDWFLRHH
ncbi:hypothetical protein ACMA1D_04890 [Streptomyces sp. 796.1]|uniref:hypothetical protein n=1 Tax=Streptomyces sp. 796.1 TaxID=3163029 RepID=UPI0039C8EA0B